MYQTYVVENCPTTRVDRWLKREFPTLTQGQLEKWLRSKDILVNDKKAEASFRVNDGDTVSVKTVLVGILSHQSKVPQHHNKPEPAEPLREHADELSHWVLYEDEELLIINKPAGLATQGGTGTTLHVDMMLKAYSFYYCKRKQLRLVHRLDRDTSGVLVIAKSLKAANHLADQFKMNTMGKVYWAVAHGKPSPLHGMIDAPLFKKANHGGGETMNVDFKEGKKAQTSFRVVKSFSNLSWFELRPHTGRTHQLRVHLAYIDNPIIGDAKYGPLELVRAQRIDGAPALHLHARSIRLQNLDGDTMTFTAPPPSHMVATIKRHGVDWENFA